MGEGYGDPRSQGPRWRITHHATSATHPGCEVSSAAAGPVSALQRVVAAERARRVVARDSIGNQADIAPARACITARHARGESNARGGEGGSRVSEVPMSRCVGALKLWVGG